MKTITLETISIETGIKKNTLRHYLKKMRSLFAALERDRFNRFNFSPEHVILFQKIDSLKKNGNSYEQIIEKLQIQSSTEEFICKTMLQNPEGEGVNLSPLLHQNSISNEYHGQSKLPKEEQTQLSGKNPITYFREPADKFSQQNHASDTNQKEIQNPLAYKELEKTIQKLHKINRLLYERTQHLDKQTIAQNQKIQSLEERVNMLVELVTAIVLK